MILARKSRWSKLPKYGVTWATFLNFHFNIKTNEFVTNFLLSTDFPAYATMDEISQHWYHTWESYALETSKSGPSIPMRRYSRLESIFEVMKSEFALNMPILDCKWWNVIEHSGEGRNFLLVFSSKKPPTMNYVHNIAKTTIILSLCA